MTLFKFALMGSNGVGKTYIVDRLKTRAQLAGIDVIVVTSPTRDIKLGDFQNNEGLTWEFQMMCIAERRKRQYEAIERTKFVSGIEHTLILADRCGLDELAYQWERIMSREIDYDALITDPLEDLLAFTELVAPFAMDTALWWDKVWYKPPHPDHHPEGDGDRSDSKDYQMRVDKQMREQFRLLRERSNYTDTLDVDRDKAVENIWGTITQVLGMEQPTWIPTR